MKGELTLLRALLKYLSDINRGFIIPFKMNGLLNYWVRQVNFHQNYC